MANKVFNKKNAKNYSAYLIVIIAYAAVLLLDFAGGLPSMYKGLLVPICAYIVMALSLNLTVGILGELSLGHAGFMSAGAFTGVAISIALKDSVTVAWLRLVIAMICGAVVAAVFGFIIGIPVLRLKGDYLAIVTLAFGEIIKTIFTNLYLGLDAEGWLRIGLVNKPESLGEGSKMLINGTLGISGVEKISTFTAGAVLLILALIIIFNTVKSRTGRAILAIRDNRIAAECMGINITKYKMTAFVLSAAIAGAAGALYSLNFSTITANKFDFNTSILILVFVVLGGQGNMIGSMIAATVLTILPEALRQFADYRMLVYAIVLIIIMLVTNNPTIKGYTDKLVKSLKEKLKKNKTAVKEGK